MKNYWQEVKVGDIGEVVGGGTPSTKCSDYYGGDIPWITPKDLSNFRNRYISRGERMISKLGLENSSAKMLPPFSVLFTSRAPIGYIAIAKNELCTNQGFKSIIPDPKKCDALFLYYLLKYKKNDIESIANGSTFQEVSGTALKNFEVSIPPLDEQRKIAGILSALDDKIELNNKINQNLDWEDYFRICRRIYELEKENQNLESQAQAIFKSWFVDFEPFGGKMPADWKSGTFSELITNTVGGDWGKDELQDNYTEEVYCIRGADIPDVKIGNRGKMPKRYILQKNYSLKKLNDGDLVVEISGGSPTQSTGRIAAISDYLLNRYKNKIICTNFCKSLKPRKNYSEYVYHYWQYLYDKNIFFGYENGTTGIKNLDISAFLETEPVIIPSQNILVAFAEVCRKTFAQIYHNGYENETLAQLRDTLLPKLMSGEIDVSDMAV